MISAAGSGRHAVGQVVSSRRLVRDGPRPSGCHREVDLVDGVVDGLGDEVYQEVQGWDQVVGADPDAGAVGVVFVAPELGPVALEELVVAPDGPSGATTSSSSATGPSSGATKTTPTAPASGSAPTT